MRDSLNSLRTPFWRFGLLLTALSSFAMAQDRSSVPTGSESGVSALWIFANLSFTAMRAQATGSTFWKVVTFIFGFPGTLLTLLVVTRGSERAYGIDMPRRQRS
ncbi:MAG TPA: hypothetical protein VKX25_09120 [Bryobacteraceae bacterium]|nr:hypothetical protein [Bryobacteraceae bacterium]